MLHGCGLVMDAAELVYPIMPDLPDQLEVICRHEALHVGVLEDPAPPFVFPTMRTERGLRVTGLDIELVQAIAAALSKHCGRPIAATPRALSFEDLFLELTEGKLDLFVSGKAANVPHLTATGLGYSTPYFTDTGIVAIARRPEVAERVRAAIRRHSPNGASVEAREAALSGLALAVHEGRSPHLYALTRLEGIRLVTCETLAPAFDSQDPSFDIILAKEAIARFYLSGRSRQGQEDRDWQPIVLENGEPLLLTREFYAIAMAETNYQLRWLVNDVLFELERSGRLADMRRRWFDPTYVSSERARAEGLLCPTCQESQPAQHGRCRWASVQ
ncbi:MAG: substrate-binding periplasmic protein [Nitrospirales bacterium]